MSSCLPPAVGARFSVALGRCHAQTTNYGVDSFARSRNKLSLLTHSRIPWLSSPTLWGTQLPPHTCLECRSSMPNPPRRRNFYVNYCLPPGTILGSSDPAFLSVLELASDTELLDLSNILYGSSLLSPLVKSLTSGDGSRGKHDEQPPTTQAERHALMARLEARFFFLAADAKSLLSGRRLSYRRVLLRVRKKLQIPCSEDLSTEDLESEIFLHLLQQQYSRESTSCNQAFLNTSRVPSAVGKNVTGIHLPTILKLRGKELLSIVVKGGGVVTVSRLKQMVLKMLSGKFLLELARYRMAKAAVVKTGQVAVMLETRVAVLAARQGLIRAAKGYLSLQGAMMVLGPMLWGSLFAEMFIIAVGTDYARVVRAIYAFAQIRLVRCYSWDMTKQIE